jgi:hypothetical protein
VTADRYLFISGMGRSGTTLVDKLLCNHPRMSVLSQPFPLYYVAAKRDFLATLGERDCRHPLSHYFRESRYGTAELNEFLASYWRTSADVRRLFDQMADYDGQYHKSSDWKQRIEGVRGGRFLDVFHQLLWVLRHRPAPQVIGAKETHCEEFFPFLAAQGVHCLAVVRDPRDVIASFNYGQGQRHGGQPRPTLFSVRNWRKSVHFLRLLQHSQNFHWLRYEDLVERPDEHLAAITGWLELDLLPVESWRRELRQQDGQPWSGNSSHAPRPVLNRESVGRYRQLMPESQQRFIECCCYPEMRWLGYNHEVSLADAERVFREFREPIPIQRSDFAADYSTRPEHLRQELARLAAEDAPAAASDRGTDVQEA